MNMIVVNDPQYTTSYNNLISVCTLMMDMYINGFNCDMDWWSIVYNCDYVCNDKLCVVFKAVKDFVLFSHFSWKA